MIEFSLTTRRVIELPLILVLLVVLHLSELLSWQFLPDVFKGFQVLSIIVVYLAYTRDWWPFFYLSSILLYIGSSSVSCGAPLYMASGLWMGLLVKLVGSFIPLEGRKSMALTCASAILGLKIFRELYLWNFSMASLPPFYPNMFSWLFHALLASFFGWILFPVLGVWDRIFEHDITASTHLEGLR